MLATRKAQEQDKWSLVQTKQYKRCTQRIWGIFWGNTVTHKGSCEDEFNLSYWWNLLVFWRVSPFYSTSIPTFLIPGLFGVSQPVSSRFRRMCERVWWSYVSSAVWQWCPLRTVWCWNVLLEVGNYEMICRSIHVIIWVLHFLFSEIWITTGNLILLYSKKVWSFDSFMTRRFFARTMRSWTLS